MNHTGWQHHVIDQIRLGTRALVKIECIIGSSKYKFILAHNLQVSVRQLKMNKNFIFQHKAQNQFYKVMALEEENQYFGIAWSELRSKLLKLY